MNFIFAKVNLRRVENREISFVMYFDFLFKMQNMESPVVWFSQRFTFVSLDTLFLFSVRAFINFVSEVLRIVIHLQIPQKKKRNQTWNFWKSLNLVALFYLLCQSSMGVNNSIIIFKANFCSFEKKKNRKIKIY